MPFREYHLTQLLEGWEKTSYPLDLYISFYFKDHKALGSKDRAAIAEMAYALIRWKGVVRGKDWKEKLQDYQKRYPFDEVEASFPKELFQEMEISYGREKALQLCRICNERAPTTVRVNPLKTSRETLLEKWRQHYDVAPCKESALGILFQQKIHFFSLPEFKEGLFEIQDEASQLVADLVEAMPGSLVLDYCAGSGGKTLAFAHKMEGKGQIFLHDIRGKILLEAKRRLRRAGIQNAQVIKDLSKWKGKMDLVLVDVPCSGTGTLRRNPDLKWRYRGLEHLIQEQRTLFAEALRFLKMGGQIVYATCSLLAKENEEQCAYFAKEHDLEIIRKPFKSLPTEGGMDGFYAAVFQKKKK